MTMFMLGQHFADCASVAFFAIGVVVGCVPTALLAWFVARHTDWIRRQR